MTEQSILQGMPISILDVVPVLEGETVTSAFHRTRRIAIHADTLGFRRYWFAEHHNSVGVASSVPPLLIGYIAEVTKQIRVGSGGVMLPNHAPYAVAEQFGTLHAMYPGRIDLALGRAPGTDPFTARALRRQNINEDFEQNVLELNGYLRDAQESDAVRAFPAGDDSIPLWLLGSSLFSAELAAKRGLPYAFASHFAPDYLLSAAKLYQGSFQPSQDLQKPYFMAGANVILADTDEEAAYLATSYYQFFLGIVRRARMTLQPPVDNMEMIWTAYEKQAVEQSLRYAFVGSPQTVRRQLEQFVELTGANELIVSSYIYDERARHHSYTLLKQLFD